MNFSKKSYGFIFAFFSIPPKCLRSNQHWLISTPCSILPEKGPLEETLKFDSNVLTVQEEEENSLSIIEWYQIPNGKRVQQIIARWRGEKQKLVGAVL